MQEKILHKIAHMFHINRGICESYYEGEKLMMSFVCGECGERSGIHCIDEIIDRELNQSP